MEALPRAQLGECQSCAAKVITPLCRAWASAPPLSIGGARTVQGESRSIGPRSYWTEPTGPLRCAPGPIGP